MTSSAETSSAERVIKSLAARGLTLGTAESLTGGLVCAHLVDVPGASSVVRGAVVAYASDLKAEILGVDADLLTTRGAVDPEVALGMAQGVRRLLGVDIGVATTGVAGPEPADGQPVGRVYVAVDLDSDRRVVGLDLTGDRQSIREEAVEKSLQLVLQVCGLTPAG